jgi:hypothetical protein
MDQIGGDRNLRIDRIELIPENRAGCPITRFKTTSRGNGQGETRVNRIGVNGNSAASATAAIRSVATFRLNAP